ncbi:Similar to Transposon TX1 uncharacterized 149 kDa protein (Xenopus laevis) [Cotesia congregata]|uniref:Similar to Transposon TX1 uncharacterized 149 kDa protein (Xenopus laevis) n=1 Tax=Cotesia congregata TaxID=51543 RepID=A0A8J2H9I7_COTCN|nr:Similar to Transposon TX1 uncharacterized 149 kDa protein (Xenopus laevis) [Cotesia congregata]
MSVRFQGIPAYALFVDFQRAFDSVPHDKLWNKLIHLGLSTKITNILKKLYASAEMQVRHENLLSEPIRITLGVLQGEILSALLFILYISDLVPHLQSKNIEGLNLGGSDHLLALKYADDLVLLSRTAVHLKNQLKALESYCDSNELTVNISKTKILRTSSSGRAGKRNETFFYKGSTIDLVSSYTYLGVTFNTSLQGDAATCMAINKNRIASGTVSSILTKLKAESWLGKVQTYNCMCRSMLLYLAHLWCLKPNNLERLESAHLEFYKKILSLPVCTPNYALRIELNLQHTSILVLKQALTWVIRILEMDESRLPKKCFLRLNALRYTFNNSKHNWVQQLAVLLNLVQEADLLNKLDPTIWKSRKQDILKKYSNHLKKLDADRYANSSSCQFILPNPIYNLSQVLNNPQRLIKPIIQIRLSNFYSSFISIDRETLTLTPQKHCQLCHLQENEDIIHFLTRCPFYQNVRTLFWGENTPQEIMEAVLGIHRQPNLKKILNYLKSCFNTKNNYSF